jgi:hypothetical protein
MKKLFTFCLAGILSFAILSCDKDDTDVVADDTTDTTSVDTTSTNTGGDTDTTTEETPVVTPDSYNFDNVSYGGQTARLGMLGEIVTMMKTGNTAGTQLSAETLISMYKNDGATFTDATLNESTKDLFSKTYEYSQARFEGYLTSVAAISGDTVPGANGTAGVVTTGSKSYLCNADGMEYTQLFEKGLFGACYFNQIANSYLTDAKIGAAVDNVTVEEGKGTAMQHHWDEAFGYFGVPTDFPTNTEGLVGLGKYCNKVDEQLGCNKIIMDAFKTGRAAINVNNHTVKNAQVVIIVAEIERVLAAVAVHYLNGAIENIALDANRNHELSEAWAFIGATQYSPTAVMNSTSKEAVEASIGTNFFEVTNSGLNEAKDAISTLYGFDAFKNDL